MQTVFSNSGAPQIEAPIVGKAADPIPHATQKLKRGFLIQDVERKSIFVVLELLPRHSRKEQLSVPKHTAMKNSNTSKRGNQEKDEEEHQPKGEETFDDRQDAVLPSCFKGQPPFDEKVSF